MNTTKTWHVVTTPSAVWGVGQDEESALKDARSWSPEFDADAFDVNVGEYRLAADGEDAELSTNYMRGFALPKDLEDALNGAAGLVEV